MIGFSTRLGNRRGAARTWLPAARQSDQRVAPLSRTFMSSETRVAMPQLRLRLTAASEARIRSGHPWVFAKSIREKNREGKSGELAVVYDRKDRFLAIGLFDPDSPLRVR